MGSRNSIDPANYSCHKRLAIAERGVPNERLNDGKDVFRPVIDLRREEMLAFLGGAAFCDVALDTEEIGAAIDVHMRDG